MVSVLSSIPDSAFKPFVGGSGLHRAASTAGTMSTTNIYHKQQQQLHVGRSRYHGRKISACNNSASSSSGNSSSSSTCSPPGHARSLSMPETAHQEQQVHSRVIAGAHLHPPQHQQVMETHFGPEEQQEHLKQLHRRSVVMDQAAEHRRSMVEHPPPQQQHHHGTGLRRSQTNAADFAPRARMYQHYQPEPHHYHYHPGVILRPHPLYPAVHYSGSTLGLNHLHHHHHHPHHHWPNEVDHMVLMPARSRTNIAAAIYQPPPPPPPPQHPPPPPEMYLRDLFHPSLGREL